MPVPPSLQLGSRSASSVGLLDLRGIRCLISLVLRRRSRSSSLEYLTMHILTHFQHTSHTLSYLNLLPPRLAHALACTLQLQLATHAILDDGADRSIVLLEAVQCLHLHTQPETISRTVRQDVVQLDGASVSFGISLKTQPDKMHQWSIYCRESRTVWVHISCETATRAVSSSQRYPARANRPCTPSCPYWLRLCPSHYIPRASDYGPPWWSSRGSTRLGWTLQGPASLVPTQKKSISCTLTCFKSELLKHIERLWQIDTLPYVNEKTVTRTKQDKLALDLLQRKTVRIKVDGVMRYATPLLRAPNFPVLHVLFWTSLCSLGLLTKFTVGR